MAIKDKAYQKRDREEPERCGQCYPPAEEVDLVIRDEAAIERQVFTEGDGKAEGGENPESLPEFAEGNAADAVFGAVTRVAGTTKRQCHEGRDTREREGQKGESMG